MIKNLKFTQSLKDEMQSWRHEIHRKPELDFEVQNTAKMVASLLTKFGIEVHTNVGKSGVVGVLKKGTSNRSIGIRADMDALKILEENTFDHCSQIPGKMHACGHDGHTSMLLGAAKYLSGDIKFDGTVVFIFQPAEEHGEGAKAMIEDGLFERFPVDAVYAIHNFPSIEAGHFSVREGSIMAAEDNFEIIINGVGHHSAMPHLGKDAIIIASEVVTSLQTILSRSIDPMEHAVISVTEFITNGTTNVVPGQVILKGDTRSLSPAVQQQIEDTMHRKVKGICAANGATYQFSYKKNFVPTINTKEEALVATNVAQSVVGSDAVIGNSRAVMTSEDFGWMLQKKKGAYILLGNGKKGIGGCSLHNPKYDFNDDILTVGADFWVALVQSELTNKFI